MTDVFKAMAGRATPRDAAVTLLQQAGHAVEQAKAIRSRQNPAELSQLFAADTVAAALIQVAADIDKRHGLGLDIPAGLLENTRLP
jgi:hypothetical protein